MINFLERIVALVLFIIFLPLFFVLYIILKFDSKGSFIFKQKRIGKGGKIFTIYKIRTMVNNAERLRNKYLSLNESDGPTFKIDQDPRYTKFGKYLSHTGLDELPQLMNIIKGNMSFIGPRPLPVYEANKLPKKYQKRHQVLPGITSLWVIGGSHNLSFIEWMESDIEYIENNSLSYSLRIIILTIVLILRSIFIKDDKFKKK